MAVVGLAWLAKGNPVSARDGADGVEITLRYKVRTNSTQDGPATVLGAAGLPQRGFIYQFGNESNPYLYCRNRSPKPEGRSGKLWIVDCEFRPLDPRERENHENESGDPIFDLPQISKVTIKEKVDARKDRNGNPYVNSAGEQFRPHPKRDESRDRLTIIRNEPITSPIVDLCDEYRDKLNSGTFWNRPARRWKCEEINVENDLRIVNQPGGGTQAFPFLRVTYIFDSKKTWEDELWDYGPNYWNGETHTTGPRAGTRKLIGFMTEDGQPYDWFLNSSGRPTTHDNAEYIIFETYEDADFGALNLPDSFLDATRF